MRAELRAGRPRSNPPLLFLLAMAASSSCTGELGPGGSAAPLPGAPLPGASLPFDELVGASGVRRLSNNEIDNTIQDLLFDSTRASGDRLPPDERKTKDSPFDNDYLVQKSSTTFVDGMELLAKETAGRLLGNTTVRNRVVGCTPSSTNQWTACFTQFLKTFGRRALRRPMSQQDLELYLPLLDLAKMDGNFYTAVDVAIRAFLQDPEFLYRMEVGTPVSGKPGLYKLSGWEMASRLSYFLWGSAPSDKLLDLAEADRLAGAADLRAAAKDMAADARMKARVARFHSMWLGFEPLRISAAMRSETDALIDRVIFQERQPWQELLTSDKTFVSYDLAKQYALPQIPTTLKAGSPSQWVSYTGTKRQGILSHGSFLAVGADDDKHAPVKRGKAVRLRLLCLPVADPSAEVKKMIDEAKAMTNTTSRCRKDQLQAHSKAGACQACHQQMDPMGFGLDSYDSQGRFRLYDKDPNTGKDVTECPISGDGEIPNVGAFNGPAGLGDLLISSGSFAACGSTQAYRLAMGRSDLDDIDQKFVSELLKRVGGKDFLLDDLLVELVAMEAFQHRREDEQGAK